MTGSITHKCCWVVFCILGEWTLCTYCHNVLPSSCAVSIISWKTVSLVVHRALWLQNRQTALLLEDGQHPESCWQRSSHRQRSHFYLCQEVRSHLSRLWQSPSVNWCRHSGADWREDWRSHKQTAVCVPSLPAGSVSVSPRSCDLEDFPTEEDRERCDRCSSCTHMHMQNIPLCYVQHLSPALMIPLQHNTLG